MVVFLYALFKHFVHLVAVVADAEPLLDFVHSEPACGVFGVALDPEHPTILRNDYLFLCLRAGCNDLKVRGKNLYLVAMRLEYLELFVGEKLSELFKGKMMTLLLDHLNLLNSNIEISRLLHLPTHRMGQQLGAKADSKAF